MEVTFDYVLLQPKAAGAQSANIVDASEGAHGRIKTYLTLLLSPKEEIFG